MAVMITTVVVEADMEAAVVLEAVRVKVKSF